MWKNYIKISLRNIRKHKLFSVINFVGLSLSLSLALFLVLLLQDQNSYDRFIPDGQNIYRIICYVHNDEGQESGTATVPAPVAKELETQYAIPQEGVTKMRRQLDDVLRFRNEDFPVEGLFADAHFFQVFPLDFKYGTPDALRPGHIVLMESLANKLFGTNENPVGKTVHFEKYGDFIVSGVLAKFPGKTHLKFDVLASYAAVPGLEKAGVLSSSVDNWDNYYETHVYVKLKNKAALADLNSALQNMVKQHPMQEKGVHYTLEPQPLDKIIPGPLLSNTLGDFIPLPILYVFSGLVGIILLMAFFNYTNLTLARNMERTRELGMRKVLGANRVQLFRQFTVESVVFTLVSFIGAFLLSFWLMSAFEKTPVSQILDIHLHYTPSALILSLILVGGIGALAGMLPAWLLSKVEPDRILRNQKVLEGKGKWSFTWGRALLVFQFVIALFFITTLVVLRAQTHMIFHYDNGYSTQNVLTLPLYGQDYHIMEQKVSSFSGVQSVAASSHLPTLGRNYTCTLQQNAKGDAVTTSWYRSTAGFLKTLDIPLVAGHDLKSEDNKGVIINQLAVKALGFENAHEALNQNILLDSTQSVRVVGVMPNIHYERLNHAMGPMILSQDPDFMHVLLVKTFPGKEKQVAAGMQNFWKSWTSKPFDLDHYTYQLEDSYSVMRMLVKIVSYFSAIIISIASLGLLGMMVFQTQRRLKELSIKKLFGASPGQLLLSMLKGTLWLLGIALFIALPLTIFVNKMWLQQFAYKVSLSYGFFIIGVGLTLLLTALVIGRYLWKVLNLDPARVLKSE